VSDAVVPGRAEAAAPFAVPVDPAARAAAKAATLRKSGIVRGLVAWVVAGVLFFFGRSIVGSVAASLGSLTLLLALVSPGRGYAALEKLVDRFAELVGQLLAWVLLAPVFFLFFVPFRLLFRRGAKDTLARGFDRGKDSYWSKHERVADLEKPY
jgi:hypothetical protein